MYKLLSLMLIVFCIHPDLASAQFVDDERSGPFWGGAGDYVYPVLCTQCKVWQDYRNFAWNQLSINGGYAHTPNNPGNETTFRIYTHPTVDLYPAVVEIGQETIDVEIMGNEVGQRPGDHYFIDTHPESGDNVPTTMLPEDMGPLVFPYAPLPGGQDPADPGAGDSPGGGGSSGGGGDAPGGGSGGGFFGGGGGPGGGSLGGGGPPWGGGGGHYCGVGTNFHCIIP
jgi:hypothetical protein